MAHVVLPPELERFAADAIASGRFRDMEDVVRSGVGLLQQLEGERAQLLASLREAEAEADAAGPVDLDQVDAGMRQAIRDTRRRA
jgi:putative addiction module CopG family antidote